MLRKIAKKLPIFQIFFRTKSNFNLLSDEAYYKLFGVDFNDGQLRIIGDSKKKKKKNRKKLELAYSKAWEIRNFEIDKFWIRTAYFWGFIVLTFGGYISVITSDNYKNLDIKHLDFYLILLGFLFSLTWLLSIKGSKDWQENWEKHIGKLEELVSGPIYRTGFGRERATYSVSKLNEILSYVIIFIWLLLAYQHSITNFEFTLQPDLGLTMALLGTLLFSIILIFGYPSGYRKADKEGFIDNHQF